MCGIVGIVGRDAVAGQVIEALRRLEYRGYDSAGIATLEHGRLARRRASGKLVNLEAKLAQEPLTGTIGIGHTRWATHGRPNETNAHPHATARLAVVHNGIIENFRELKQELEADGVVFETETDTEVVAQLVSRNMDRQMGPVEAVAAALPRLRGAFALGFLFSGEENLLIGARHGAPLAIGFGEGETYLGSDALALAPFTDAITYLDEGDWAILSRGGAEIRDASGATVERARQKIATQAYRIDKGEYRHFMAKEIHEQPEVVGRTLAHYVDMANGRVMLPEALPFDFAKLSRVYITACGTAYYAGLVARYWFEQVARLPVEIDVASEARYREAPLEKDGLTLVISQSGETADTLASLRYAKTQGQHTLSVVNVPTSTIARESSVVMPTLAGPEIGVASTKAFSCQLTVLLCARHRGGARPRHARRGGRAALVDGLIEAPRPDGGGADPRGGDRGSGAGGREGAGRALSRPRHQLPAGAGRRAEAEGDQLHPRRGLRGGRAEARADRPDRRERAGDRHRAARRGVREDRLEHAGGGRPRRAHRADRRRQGRGRARAGHARDLHHAGARSDGGADRVRGADPAARLPHGGVHGERRRPAPQPRQIGHGRVGAADQIGGSCGRGAVLASGATQGGAALAVWRRPDRFTPLARTSGPHGPGSPV
jgi:glucosamine--fructose-6-phosphate aminotransferase (isomerizing)